MMLKLDEALVFFASECRVKIETANDNYLSLKKSGNSFP